MRHFLRVTGLWIVLLPYLFYFAGFVSNQLVLIANHDRFPVMLNAAGFAHFHPGADGLIDKEHCVMTDDTHFNVLADIFDMHSGWFSVGDFMLMFSDWLSGFCVYVWAVLVVKSLYQRRRYDDEAA